MTELDEQERALIDLARDAHDPSDQDRVRVQAALSARLGAVAGLGMAASLGSSAKVAAAAGAGGGLGAGATGGAVAGGMLAVKLIGAAVVVASAVGVHAVAVHHARRAPVAIVTASARSGASRHEAPAISSPGISPPASVQNAETELPPGGCDRCVGTPERGQAAAAVGAATETRLSVARPPERSTPSGGAEMIARPPEGAGRSAGAVARPPRPALAGLPTLADEARLFQDGVAALRAGRPARALALFDGHALIYPDGALAEERAAERVLALADLGRAAEAHAAAAEFLRAHPTSPLAARLRERLGELDARNAGAPAGAASDRSSK